MRDRVEVVLYPSTFRIMQAAGVAVLGVAIGVTVIQQATMQPGRAALQMVLPFLVIFGLIAFQSFRFLRVKRIVLTPDGIDIATGGRTETVRWDDVKTILLGRISMQKGSTMGVAIQLKSGGAVKLHDVYARGRKEVFAVLADYAAAHAPHVVAEREPGWLG